MKDSTLVFLIAFVATGVQKDTEFSDEQRYREKMLSLFLRDSGAPPYAGAGGRKGGHDARRALP